VRRGKECVKVWLRKKPVGYGISFTHWSQNKGERGHILKGFGEITGLNRRGFALDWGT